MRHRARVHQRGGGVAVLVTEIGADQLALLVADLRAVEAHHVLDLVIAGHEDAPRLPMPRLEIAQDELELVARLARRHLKHFAHQPLGAARAIGGRRPGEMEGPHHDPRRIGVQPQLMVEQIHARAAPRLPLPAPGIQATARSVPATPTNGCESPEIAHEAICSAKIDSAP